MSHLESWQEDPFTPKPGGTWVTERELFELERQRQLMLHQSRLPEQVYYGNDFTDRPRRRYGRVVIVAASLLLLGLAGAKQFGGDEPKQQIGASVTPNSSVETPSDTTENKGSSYTTSPEAFLPKPFCQKVVDINISQSFIPVTWNTTVRNFPDGNDFPAVIEGTASVQSCLNDISAIKLSKKATKESGVTTYKFNIKKFDTTIVDLSDIKSYIAIIPPEELLKYLGDPSLTIVDAQSIISQITGHEGEIDQRNLALIKDAIYMREVPILELASDALQQQLETQAEVQGINPSKIRIVPVANVSKLGFEKSDAPPDRTAYFDYQSQTSPQITVVAHPEPQE